MADIKLDPAEQALFNEVGSRGDYFREAIRDRAADQVATTRRMSEITTEGGQVLDVVPAPVTSGPHEIIDDVVPPSLLESVIGPAPGSDPPSARSTKP
jgi:hypothetical protein